MKIPRRILLKSPTNSTTSRELLTRIVYSGATQRPQTTLTNASLPKLLDDLTNFAPAKSRRLPRSSTSPNLDNLKTGLVSKKNAYNRLKAQNDQFERWLKIVDPAKGQPEAQLSKKTQSLATMQQEYEEIHRGLENELYNQSVLHHMIHARKHALNCLTKPIEDLKEEVRTLSLKVDSSLKAKYKLKTEVKQLATFLRTVKHTETDFKKTQRSVVDYKTQQAKHLQLMDHALVEGEVMSLNEEAIRQHSKAIHELKPAIAQLEFREQELKSLRDIEKKLKENRAKFKLLKNATCISSIQEAKSYYKYLKVTKDTLEEAKREAAAREHELELRLKEATEDRNASIRKHEHATHQFSTKMYQDSIAALTETNKRIQDGESLLERLNQTLLVACGTVSRMCFLTQGEWKDCKPSNLSMLFRQCNSAINHRFDQGEVLENQAEPKSIQLFRRSRPSYTLTLNNY